MDQIKPIFSDFLKNKFIGFVKQAEQAGYNIQIKRNKYLFTKDNVKFMFKVNDDSFYRKSILFGSLGFGESYMKGWLTTDNLYELLIMFIRISNYNPSSNRLSAVYTFLLDNTIHSRIFHRNNIHIHYDVHERLYKAMLDEHYMAYTCGYISSGDDPDTISLEKLQTNKMELICRKLDLQKRMRILDIGCGYGGFLIYAAEKYDCHGVGFSISKQQTEIGRDLVERAGVSNVQLYENDLSFLAELPSGSFDRIVSIGCFEHIETRQYPYVFGHIKRLLKHNGKGLIHAIGSVTNPITHDSFIQTYIFPNSGTILLSDISRELETRDMGIVHVENIARHYYYTLKHWLERSNKEFMKNKSLYSTEFKRMWIMYLTMCMSMSKIGSGALYQITFNATGNAALGLHLKKNAECQ